MFEIYSQWSLSNTLGVGITGLMTIIFSYQLSRNSSVSFFKNRLSRMIIWVLCTIITYCLSVWSLRYGFQNTETFNFFINNYPFLNHANYPTENFLETVVSIQLHIPAIICIYYLFYLYFCEKKGYDYHINVREAFVLTYMSLLTVDWMHMHTFKITREIYPSMGIGGAGLMDGLVIIPLLIAFILSSIKYVKNKKIDKKVIL